MARRARIGGISISRFFDGEDCLEVASTRNGRRFHRTDDERCRRVNEDDLVVYYDLYAARLEGLDPCTPCFEDDPHVEVDA